MASLLPTIHQLVPTLDSADAVGAHTLRLRDGLRAAGVRSDVFSDDVARRLAGEARPIAELPAPDPDRMALIYQCSIGNEIVDLLLRRPDPLVVNYHNLTPVGQLLRWAPDMAHLAGWGRNQLSALATRAAIGIGDSAYNTAELRAAGFSRADAIPILLDVEALRHEPGPDGHRSQRGGRWLFVGRIVPNKAQHDVIAAFAWYREVHDPAAELHLVGKDAAPAYRAALDRLVAELDLGEAVRFTGAVDDRRLGEEYARADVFVCLSDHEGFCIPVLEAMANDVAVVAFASTAVPETVGPAGLLLPGKDPALVANAAHRVINDPVLRAQLVERGRVRISEFDRGVTIPRFLAALAELS